MSYKLPFSNPAAWSVRKIILVSLIALHAVWIGIHLNLVSKNLINPWKLGGYGMYTTANNGPVLHISDRRFEQFFVSLTESDRTKIMTREQLFRLPL